jgi:hypothetical protein
MMDDALTVGEAWSRPWRAARYRRRQNLTEAEKQILVAEEEVAWYRHLYRGLEEGTVDYRVINDDYTCTDKTGAAIDDCCELLKQAEERLAALTGGTR